MVFPTTRLRRLRSNPRLRALVAETRLSPEMLVWPVFVVPGKGVTAPISTMPGVSHSSVDIVVQDAKRAWDEGVRSLLLFGIPERKDDRGSSAYDRNGIIPTALRALKDALPEMLLITDVCLCAYTSHGHCGLVDERGTIANDPTLELLSAMALVHARAGADMVAPSDMMDGRIAAIRRALDGDGFQQLPIMSYAAKYASSFYGPFREAAHSAPAFGDRRSYQMDPTNAKEALREIELDVAEGADIVMIKPALPSLDVIAKARERFDLPIAAYQVSGEYAMLKLAARDGWLDEQRAIEETLTAIARAGADIIVSYFARDVARSLA